MVPAFLALIGLSHDPVGMAIDAVTVSEKQSFSGAGSIVGIFSLGFDGGQGQTVASLLALC